MVSWLTRWFHGAPPEVVFRFEEKQTKLLGVTYRPMAEVGFWSEPDQSWLLVRMLIDTGADFTLLPKFWARLLGIDLRDAQVERTSGLGGWEVVYFVPNVRVKLGEWERVIPVGFADSDRVPPLLGRHLFFETFETTFVGKSQITIKKL